MRRASIPSDGTHTFTNTAPASALIGATGVWNDAGDSSSFAPVNGSQAAVIGGNGSISQMLSTLTPGR